MPARGAPAVHKKFFQGPSKGWYILWDVVTIQMEKIMVCTSDVRFSSSTSDEKDTQENLQLKWSPILLRLGIEIMTMDI